MTQRLVEPFAGSAAITIAAASYGKARSFLINDSNVPLMRLWDLIINDPLAISLRYEHIWQKQLGREQAYFNEIRDDFNRSHEPGLFLFLLTRCVKASVRYNANGDFNQSPDNRRKGTAPPTMRRHITDTSRVLRGRTAIHHLDYRDVLREATANDLVYMDPPYQGVSNTRDPRYVGGVSFDQFARELATLNERSVPYIVSYDGRTGSKSFGHELPSSLELTRIEVEVGRSSQATLLGKDHVTYESLYLSPAIAHRAKTTNISLHPPTGIQPPLFEAAV